MTVAAVMAGLTVAVVVASPPEEDATVEPATIERQEVEAIPVEEQVDYTPEEAAEVEVVDPQTPRLEEGKIVAEMAPNDLPTFELLGVTWTGGMTPENSEVQARWRQEGVWSDWTLLEVEDAEVEGGIPGTAPKWIGPSDAAEVRVVATGEVNPEELTLVTVDSGEGATLTPTAVSQPGIVTRGAWGARSGSTCDTPRFGTMSGTIVHHTAGSNSYTADQAPGIVRSIQAYHMDGQNWCDIGYNFLIDQYGKIYEGRAGGITETPRGAHAGNWDVNLNTTGVSLMGTFVDVAPNATMKSALVRLIAWRHALHEVPAIGTYSLGGKTLNRIDGHYRVQATACPGTQVINWLPTLRTEVDQTINPPTVGGFSDVYTTSPFADEIAWLSSQGISTGWTQDGRKYFRPSSAVLRDQMAAFLYRFQGSPSFTPPTQSPFVDLSTRQTFYKEISWLAQSGVTAGWMTDEGTEFRPSSAVLRDQMAAFLYRVATIRNGGQAPAVTLPTESPFADVSPGHVFYKEIVWMWQTGLSTGWAGSGSKPTFRPYQPVLRDQMAAFLYRFDGLPSSSSAAAESEPEAVVTPSTEPMSSTTPTPSTEPMSAPGD
ncbi:MAG: S-layer homology domain-containing protein [Aeromicrobium sp.]|uniref:N-acetylmuramoyl-L-alanine amidase n=1 Tax=Aeromicrobium sp. TaxID=1871063 RepID=UPI0039E3AB71